MNYSSGLPIWSKRRNMSSASCCVLALICCCLLKFQPIFVTAANDLSTYIVHVDVHPDDLLSWYNSSVLSTNLQQPRSVLLYRHVFPGFAAKLSEADLESLRQTKGFVSARPERVYPLHTTHSPKFMGLVNQSPPAGFWNISNYGKGVIIGLLDTGITPGHPSFGDDGMPPPPPKWKGECQLSACNNKLIGARFFGDEKNPLDETGHGTHTASTAAGNFVDGANVLGSANGTASGIAPRAHLAVYRVCDFSCFESRILAGFDAAISDGVDIISVSVGSNAAPFYDENLAIGAYRATQMGILVSAGAGNGGPTNVSVTNVAPWVLTVGASTIDRKLQVTAVLGNDEVIYGESAFQPNDDFLPVTNLEVVFGSDVAPYCEGGIRGDVRGKIVLCEEGERDIGTGRGEIVKDAGGAAMILIGNEMYGNVTFAEIHVLPAMHITYADGQKVIAYLKSNNSNHTATISFKGTVIGEDLRAPVVAPFSSRGPNRASPGILKPDIIGPGVNILAAWHRSVDEDKTGTKDNYNLESGTSMSCPHLSGAAALLKSAHPDWSPAVIKSAIMTTADHLNRGGKPIEDETWSPASVFATGAGHVNVSRANDPGLVYDIHPDDYIPYLCGLKYTNEQVGTIVQRKVDCSKEGSIPEAQLNYPSFSIVLAGRSTAPQTYTRTVTNVGEPNSSYAVEIVAPSGVNVTVKPVELKFSKPGQKLEYNVTFTGSASAGNVGSAQGSITWNSASHSVRSPIVIVFG